MFRRRAFGDALQTLKAQGHEPIPGYRNLGLHPYAIAMAEGTVDVWGEPVQGVLCALRWPQPSSNKNMEIPIVVMERGSRSMKLVARSAKEYTARVLAEEDLKAGTHLRPPQSVAAAVHLSTAEIYCSRAHVVGFLQVNRVQDP